jgi:hypothetical protein
MACNSLKINQRFTNLEELLWDFLRKIGMFGDSNRLSKKLRDLSTTALGGYRMAATYKEYLVFCA